MLPTSLRMETVETSCTKTIASSWASWQKTRFDSWSDVILVVNRWWESQHFSLAKREPTAANAVICFYRYWKVSKGFTENSNNKRSSTSQWPCASNTMMPRSEKYHWVEGTNQYCCTTVLDAHIHVRHQLFVRVQCVTPLSPILWQQWRKWPKKYLEWSYLCCNKDWRGKVYYLLSYLQCISLLCLERTHWHLDFPFYNSSTQSKYLC